MGKIQRSNAWQDIRSGKRPRSWPKATNQPAVRRLGVTNDGIATLTRVWRAALLLAGQQRTTTWVGDENKRRPAPPPMLMRWGAGSGPHGWPRGEGTAASTGGPAARRGPRAATDLAPRASPLRGEGQRERGVRWCRCQPCPTHLSDAIPLPTGARQESHCASLSGPMIKPLLLLC